MIEVYGLVMPKYKKLAKSVAELALNFMKQPDLDLTIKFVGKKEIKRLNHDFRNVDRVTDVLSFPATDAKVGDILAPCEYLGDMALCLSKAKQQGKEYNNGTMAELQKLVVHSVLHLFGYDHIEDADYVVMNKKEKEIEEYIDNWRKGNVI